MNLQRENWSSKLGFILAASGSAIGLGNIWKFPYVAGENGGAAFIIVYLICTAIIGLPVLFAEILIGRTTQLNPVGAFKNLVASQNSKLFWSSVGGMGIIAGFVILSFYSVVAGWSLGYIYESVSGVFFNAEIFNSDEHFSSLISNPIWTVLVHTVFMALTMIIVFLGVQNGIEKGSKILMPLLFFILILLVLRGITLEGANKGIEFILYPDWSKITVNSILEALGQAFFTLSLGMGAMLTYGSYMSEKDSIPTSGLQIVFLDTLIALIAGLAIFSAVFAANLNPNSGPGLIFQTLPIVFTKMPGGYYFSILFFILLTIAALTSAISLLEVVVAFFVDELSWKRNRAVVVFGLISIIIGIPSALSFNILSDYKILGLTWFDLAEFLSSNILLPLGGLMISVFVGWIWGKSKVFENIKKGSENIFLEKKWILEVWLIFLKFLSPILIFLVLFRSLNLF